MHALLGLGTWTKRDDGRSFDYARAYETYRKWCYAFQSNTMRFDSEDSVCPKRLRHSH